VEVVYVEEHVGGIYPAIDPSDWLYCNPVTVKLNPDRTFPYTTVAEFGTICRGAFTIVMEPAV
jgi:hypothetical protein